MKKNAYVYAKGKYLYAIITLNNGKQVDLPIKQVAYNGKLQWLIVNNVDNLMDVESGSKKDADE